MELLQFPKFPRFHSAHPHVLDLGIGLMSWCLVCGNVGNAVNPGFPGMVCRVRNSVNLRNRQEILPDRELLYSAT